MGATGEVGNRAAKDQTDAMQGPLDLLAPAGMEPKNGAPIGRRRQNAKSEPQPYHDVRDSFDRE